MMSRLSFALAMFLALAPAQACELRFEGLGRAAFTGAYDPFSASGLDARFDFAVRRIRGACEFAVGASRGGAFAGTRQMTQGAGRLTYELYTGIGERVLSDADTGPADGLIIGRVQGNDDTQPLAFEARLPPGQVVPAGTYGDTVIFTLYEIQGGIPRRVLDSRAVAMAATVSAVASFEAVIEGARQRLTGGPLGTLDFGALATGERLGFDLEATGNLGYDIELSSENGGVLSGLGEAAGYGVPYALIVDGRSLDLKAPAHLSADPATEAGRAANRHRFEIEIGELGNAAAGQYRDALTLTVVTR